MLERAEQNTLNCLVPTEKEFSPSEHQTSSNESNEVYEYIKNTKKTNNKILDLKFSK